MITHLNKISDFLTSNRLAINQDKTTITEVMVKQKWTRMAGSPFSMNVRDRDGYPKFLMAGKYARLLGGNISHSLANGLLITKICYLLPVWGAAPKTQLEKVQTIMNRVARFVTGWGRRTKV